MKKNVESEINELELEINKLESEEFKDALTLRKIELKQNKILRLLGFN